MKNVTVTVKFKVPDGIYCNHSMQKSKPETRCRFCTDLGKQGFVCVLYNEPLLTESGALIHKCKPCLRKEGETD